MSAVDQLLSLARSASCAGVTVVQTSATAVIVVPLATEAKGEDLLSLEEARVVAKVRSSRVLRDAARAGELTLFGRKGARVVKRADLMAWVESRGTAPLVVADDADLGRRMKRLQRTGAVANGNR